MICKNNQKKREEFKFTDICWPLKICLHDFAGQSLHCSITRGAKNEVSVILQGKEQKVWDFAGQSLHFSMISRGKGCITP